MDDKRAPVKAKNFVVNGLKRGRLKKRWKENTEKDMLTRDLKRSDAQDRAAWCLGCKNRLNPARRESKLGSRKMKLIIDTPRTNE